MSVPALEMNVLRPLISQPPSRRSARVRDAARVGTGVGLGEAERAERASLGERPEPALALVVVAEEVQRQRADRHVRLPRGRHRLVGEAELLHRGDEADGRHADAAPLLGDQHAEQAERAHLAEQVGGAPRLLPRERRARWRSPSARTRGRGRPDRVPPRSARSPPGDPIGPTGTLGGEPVPEPRRSRAVTDYDAIDFFRGNELVSDPYPYFDWLRAQCPVQREPHHDVMMVTGYEEAIAVYNDTERVLVVQLAHRPVPRVPRAARGRRRERAHRGAPAPAADERPDPHVRPAGAHRAPRAADAADHAEAPARERGVHVAARRSPDRRVRRGRQRRVHPRLRPAVRHARGRRPARRARRGSRAVPQAARRRAERRGDRARSAAPATGARAQPARVPLRAVHRVRRGAPARAARRRDDRHGERDVPRRLDPRADRRRAHRGQPLRGRPGDHGAPVRHRAPAHRRRPRPPAAAARPPRAHPELRRGVPAHREPGEGRLPPRARHHRGRRRHDPGRHHRDGRERRRQPRSRAASSARPSSRSSGRTRASTSRSATARTRARARRSRAPRAASRSSACSTGWTTSGSPEQEHGPAGARRYDYVPTYILRGVSRLHLEFDVPAAPGAERWPSTGRSRRTAGATATNGSRSRWSPSTASPSTRAPCSSWWSRGSSPNAILDDTYDGAVPTEIGFDDFGATLHVCGTADGLEHLRFDCFENEPHYHYIDQAAGANVVVRIDELAVGDPDRVLARVRRRTTSPTCSATAASPTSPTRWPARSTGCRPRWARSAS